MPIELTFECPKCRAVGGLKPALPGAWAECASCSHRAEVRAGSFDADGGLTECPLCATEDMYVQKDFPQGLGLAIVLAGFALSTVFWYQDRPVPALGVLLVSALADMVLFRVVPNVTICYRCLSQCRGESANPGGRFKHFDLAVGERYRQERIRIEGLKARSAAAVPDGFDPRPSGPA